MARLIDPDRLAAYLDALGNWSFTDYVQFNLTEHAQRWIERELGYITKKDIGRLMHEYVAAGGEIDEVRERRENYEKEHEFHHDLRLTIHAKRLYVETRLHLELPFVPDEPWIEVVNIHDW